MFVNPKEVIENGWVKFPEWMNDEFKQKCIQPNALDFTIDMVFDHVDDESFMLSEELKVMRNQTKQQPVDGYFEIDTMADIMSDFFISVPAGYAAYLIVRSTLNRNGLFITSGLYDQGFSNYIGCILHNRGPVAYIAPNTRIGQIIFVKTDDSGIMYNGIYNTNNGEHWTTTH